MAHLMLTERSQRIVLERDQGEPYTVIAARAGVSYQRARAVVADATAFLNRVELDLLAATKTGECCAYLVPFGVDYQVAMSFGDWLCRQLRERGVQLEVTTRTAANGVALLLTDITPRRP
jgi:hypothetical protein